MKIAVIILRTLMGLLFLFASITYLFDLITPPEPTGTQKIFTDGLEASVYILPTVKIIELICGIAFVSGRFVPLASILIAPIIVNIVLINIFIDSQAWPMAVLLVVANSLTAFTHRDRYKPLLTR